MLGLAAGVVLLLLWLAGKFAPKVPMTPAGNPEVGAEVRGEVTTVRLVRLPRHEWAVGSVRAVREAGVGSKLLARVKEINLKAGQKVQAGEVLARLDDADLRAKLQQTRAALASAEAQRGQAAADEKRYAEMFRAQAVTGQEHEKAATALRSAKAEVRRAAEAVKEAQAALDWATVRSPMNGIVIDKKVDVGDTVTPGQLLVTLYDPRQMQLVASVRESLAHQLQVGQDISVSIEGLNKQCTGTIAEIVPEAQSASRTFQVKVAGPCPAGVYTGMFGRMLIPLGPEEVLLVPRRAVRQVGQLQLADVLEGGRVTRRAVRTGRTFDGNVEVLSGLWDGEQVVTPSAGQGASHG
jgi:RND family efflux transporter MFP subunit